MGRELKDSTVLPQLINKLMFYIGFLETFTEKVENVLKENDIQHLKMLREYIVDARRFLKKDEELEKAIKSLKDLNRHSNTFTGFSVHFHFLQEARKRLEKKVLAQLRKYKVKGS